MLLPQIVSVVAVSILTVVATVIGVQIILLLKEIKISLSRFNRVLDSADAMVEKITQPISSIIGLSEGIRQSTKVIEVIMGFLNRNKDSQEKLIQDDTI